MCVCGKSHSLCRFPGAIYRELIYLTCDTFCTRVKLNKEKSKTIRSDAKYENVLTILSWSILMMLFCLKGNSHHDYKTNQQNHTTKAYEVKFKLTNAKGCGTHTYMWAQTEQWQTFKTNRMVKWKYSWMMGRKKESVGSPFEEKKKIQTQ